MDTCTNEIHILGLLYACTAAANTVTNVWHIYCKRDLITCKRGRIRNITRCCVLFSRSKIKDHENTDLFVLLQVTNSNRK